MTIGPSLDAAIVLSSYPLKVEDLIGFGRCTESGFGFMKACVVAMATIVVSGGTGTGKTTFLNVLSSFIPAAERIVDEPGILAWTALSAPIGSGASMIFLATGAARIGDGSDGT